MAAARTVTQIRDDEIYTKRMTGVSITDLAKEFDLSESRISGIVTEVSRSMPERDRSELLAVSIDRLAFIEQEVLSLLKMPGAPVAVGKDGTILHDPENDEVVRDYSLRVRALAELHRINQTFAKRLGLDAPTQAEVKASVQYEIVGVDPEELT